MTTVPRFKPSGQRYLGEATQYRDSEWTRRDVSNAVYATLRVSESMVADDLFAEILRSYRIVVPFGEIRAAIKSLERQGLAVLTETVRRPAKSGVTHDTACFVKVVPA